MSRQTIYQDQRLTIVHGIDHILGLFYQIYDNDLIHETPEGEGVVFDWSSNYGFETNMTGIPNKCGVIDIITGYITDNNSGNVQISDIDNVHINLN